MSAAVQRIAELPAVAREMAEARAAIDALMWRRDVRGNAVAFVRDSQERGARASAAIEGADLPSDDDSPMGRVLRASHDVTMEIPHVVKTWSRAPAQVLARLHVVAGVGLGGDGSWGRPRISGERAEDPLALGDAPEAVAASKRLALVTSMVADSVEAPALVVAGIVHAELLVARPFARGSGVLGRGTVRLVLSARGVDPSLFSIPEVGMMALGRPAYARAIRDYERGDVAEYFAWFGAALRGGARGTAPGIPGNEHGDGA